jgi:metal-responsive CopG/Arc/MetJ family transcriptional regulator
MARVRLWIEDELLRAADRLAKKCGMNRSRLFRKALQAYLKRERFRELGRVERKAYERLPDDLVEVELWEGVTVRPED